MKWRGRRGSSNIEDRRRSGVGAAGGIGGGGLIVVLLVGYFLGIDVTQLLDGGAPPQGTSRAAPTAEDEAAAELVSVTLADTEEVWAAIFAAQLDATYVPPTLVLFSQSTTSPCGGATAASGPFYCPADRKAYLDTDFFVTLERDLGAGGDFAVAYVVAHEVAHHIQNELGILGEANRQRAAASQVDANAISVLIELQADCLSGVWAHHAQAQLGTLEPGDIAEAMNAAARIGDDALQRGAGTTVTPDSFTHGTSAQRQEWFARGHDTGAIAACDTFAG